MKKLMMGLAALATFAFVTPAFADDAKPAGDAPAKKEHKGKKGGKKAEEKPAEAAPAK